MNKHFTFSLVAIILHLGRVSTNSLYSLLPYLIVLGLDPISNRARAKEGIPQPNDIPDSVEMLCSRLHFLYSGTEL
jgi:hypothetical protein